MLHLRRGLLFVGIIGIAAFLMTDRADAGWRHGCCCTCYVPQKVYQEPDVSVVISAPVRQVVVVYFDLQYSVWTQATALVPVKDLAVGTSVLVTVPHVGIVRAWVKEINEKPMLSSPW
jgi:hypothetical protein